MKINILTIALGVPDQELLERIEVLAATERETTAELVAHLAALELRPSLYAARGHGSLFAYCTQALHLSEDAACNRIDAARACRRFPQILDLLAAGSLTLTSIRLLKRHLTDENHEAVLRRAVNRTKEEVEALVAELDPKPDVPASVRRLPGPRVIEGPTGSESSALTSIGPVSQEQAPLARLSGLFELVGTSMPSACAESLASPTEPCDRLPLDAASATVTAQTPLSARTDRPVVKPLSPERYRVQFTVGQEDYENLKRLQTLLRRELPSGDPGTLFTRGLALLLERVEKEKLGATHSGRRTSQADRGRGRCVDGRHERTYATRIRSGTDTSPRDRSANAPGSAPALGPAGPTEESRRGRSRHVPNQVKRTVWWRDRGQCAFVSKDGRRCTERSFLELHHIQPYALDGPATIGNIALRCRVHNAYEAEVVFGARTAAPAGGS